MMLVVIGRLGREVQSTFMLTNSYIIQCFKKKISYLCRHENIKEL